MVASVTGALLAVNLATAAADHTAGEGALGALALVGNRAPQFRHGGVVFAPQPRDYVVKVPKKVRRLAMKSALTSKYNEGAILVVDQITLADAKTRLMAEVLKNLGAEKKALLVLAGRDETIIRASKNIPTVKDAYVNTINVYDLLNADKIIVLKAAMESIQEVYA